MGNESSSHKRRAKTRSQAGSQDFNNNYPASSTPFPLPNSRTMRFKSIADRFSNIEQIQEELQKEGLESSNLLVALDFTKSNEWNGKKTFGGQSLHCISDVLNPYEQAIQIIGQTLSKFDLDNLIPAYGFGDALTDDRAVFSFLPGDQPCEGVPAVLARYRSLVPKVRLAGPTSFGPAIDKAVEVVRRSGGGYHILLIVADGQVTRSSDTSNGELSPQESATVNAIVRASEFPLSIVLVGVGDGPWDLMREFDDALPARKFDNFQFVNFSDLLLSAPKDKREAWFALKALMEIPEQYKLIKQLGLLGRRENLPRLPPPVRTLDPPDCVGGTVAPPTSHPAYAFFAPPPAVGAPSATPYPSYPYPSYPYPSAALPPPSPGWAAAAVSSSKGGTSGTGPETQSNTGSSSASGSASGSGTSVAPSASAPLDQSPSKSSFGFGLGYGSGSESTPGSASGSLAKVSASMAALNVGMADTDPLFLCPITQEVMDDPVIAADGYTYERTAIEKWLGGHRTSPMSNAPMGSKVLFPNNALKSAIKEWMMKR